MDRIEFLEARRKGVGGSDVSAIMSMNKYRNPMDVYLDKTGQTEVSEDMNEACYWGTTMEPVLVAEFELRTGLKVKTDTPQTTHKDLPFLMGNIDGYIESENAGLECKTAGAFVASEWGEEGTDEIPTPYYLQVQHYMNIYNIDMFYVAVLIGGNDFRIYNVERNNAIIEKIETVCSVFWLEHVVEELPPELYDTYALKSAQAIAAIKGSSIATDDADTIHALSLLKDLKQEEKMLEDRIKEGSKLIQETMDENETLISSDGTVLCTWKESVSKRLDSKKLKAEKPEIFEEYATESKRRTFLVK